MPTKRLNINLTDEETIDAFIAATILLASVSGQKYTYTDIVKILSRYALQHPRLIIKT